MQNPFIQQIKEMFIAVPLCARVFNPVVVCSTDPAALTQSSAVWRGWRGRPLKPRQTIAVTKKEGHNLNSAGTVVSFASGTY